MPSLPPALQGWLFNQGVTAEAPIISAAPATLDQLADLYAELAVIEKRQAKGTTFQYPAGPDGEQAEDWNEADEAKMVGLVNEWLRVTCAIGELEKAR